MLSLVSQDADRPTSNPLPPQSEAFGDYKNALMSAQHAVENVAQQVPNFGTEQVCLLHSYLPSFLHSVVLSLFLSRVCNIVCCQFLSYITLMVWWRHIGCIGCMGYTRGSNVLPSN